MNRKQLAASSLEILEEWGMATIKGTHIKDTIHVAQRIIA